MKKISIGSVLFLGMLNASTVNLSQGWNLVGLDGDFNASSLSSSSGISQATSGGVTAGNGLTYIRSAYASGESLRGQGYWVYVDTSSATLTYTSASIDFVFMKSGWNLVNLPTDFNATSFANYSAVTQATSGGVTAGSGLTYIKDAYTSGSAIDGQGYWVYTTGNVLIGSDSNLSTQLPSVGATTLTEKSFVMVDSSVNIKLITFENNTYKLVDISSFNINELNNDLNSITLSTKLGTLPSVGECGNWNFNTTNSINMTPIDDANVTQTTVAGVYTSSDGNFTIGTDSYNIVWYGDDINISSSITCQINGIPAGATDPTGDNTPPTVPN